MRCEVCGNDYHSAMQIRLDGTDHVFDSFECAIQALAPKCAACGCRIIGHGIEKNDVIYCCHHCAADHVDHADHRTSENAVRSVDITGRAYDDEVVDEASRESFPASDAPAW